MEEILSKEDILRNKRLKKLALVSKNLRELEDKMERLEYHRMCLKNRKHSLTHLLSRG